MQTPVAGADPGMFGARPARTDIERHGDPHGPHGPHDPSYPYYPYVRRAFDDDVAAALDARVVGTDRRPLILVGPAMSGTSRTAAETLRRHPVLSGWTLLVPPAGADLAAAVDLVPDHGVVLWLDHVEDVIVRMGSQTLEAWARRDRLVVLGTVRPARLEGVLEDRDFHSPWSVLVDHHAVQTLRLPLWTADELPPGAVPRWVRGRVARGESLGEVLGAASEIVARISESDPFARAVGRVVVDWARMGLRDGIPDQVAEQLWQAYVPRRELSATAGPQRRPGHYQQQVEALLQPLPATPARIITRAGPGRLRPDDYLVAHPLPGWATIGRHVWAAGLVHARATGDPELLLVFGMRAYIAEAYEAARGAWDTVARMDTPLSGWGRALLGQLHAGRRGSRDEALAALYGAIEAGHPDAGPAAASAIARLLEVCDPDGAREAYEWVVDSGHPALAPEAALRLGWLLEWDNPRGARAAYEAAVRSNHPDLAPEAAVYLAWMLEPGDPEAAREAYRYAIDSGQQEWAPMASADLGTLVADTDPERARAAYRTAIASGHPEWAPRAAIRLGQLLAGTDPEGAAAAYSVAVASRHGEWAPMAAVSLGVLLAQRRPMDSCAALRVAIGSHHDEYEPMAEVLYGEWCVGDDASARWRHWSRAASFRNPRVLVDIACLCLAEGNQGLARRALANARKAGSAFAADYLHVLSVDPIDLIGDPSFRRVRRAAEVGDTPSMDLVGLLAASVGDLASARTWWIRAAAEQDVVAPMLLRRQFG